MISQSSHSVTTLPISNWLTRPILKAAALVLEPHQQPTDLARFYQSRFNLDSFTVTDFVLARIGRGD